MAKQTLLEVVQDILASLESDEVNSINDTEEAFSVARIIRDSYNAITSISNLPEHWSPFELEATSIASPTVMTLPTTVDELHWIKYNKQEDITDPIDYQEITFLEWNDFAKLMYSLDTTDDNVNEVTYTVGSDSIDIIFQIDKMPEYYTTWDDNIIIFDSYDSTYDANLQKNKTICFGRKAPTTFSMTDLFVPDLDANQFNILVNEARAQAWLEIKQASNIKAEQRARKGWIHSQGHKDRVINKSNPLDKLPNYGRKVR
jgi:hypothetical protein